MARATLTVAETNRVDNLMLPKIQPGSLAEPQNRPAPFSLIDWTECSDVAVKIRFIDTQISFLRRKMYWFAGLSGGLGLALCEWLVRYGANYFVISSRQPKVHDCWCEKMRELGVVLKIRLGKFVKSSLWTNHIVAIRRYFLRISLSQLAPNNRSTLKCVGLVMHHAKFFGTCRGTLPITS